MKMTLVFRALDADYSSDPEQRDNRMTRGCLVDVLPFGAHPGLVIVADPRWRVVHVENPDMNDIEDLLAQEVEELDGAGQIRVAVRVRGKEKNGDSPVIRVRSKRVKSIDLDKLEREAGKGATLMPNSEINCTGKELGKLVVNRVSRRSVRVRS